ncbi:hypothetical protein [Phyllobacterium sp. 22552]|uniref:hypothetical protein n=1 Tax=Phyllobacterium sp. 22552 TaxID=3453941 RepID=UPI003F87870C
MSIVSKAKGILKVGGNYCLHDWCAWFDKLTMREVEDCRSQDLHRWPLIMQPITFPHGELVEPRTKLLQHLEQFQEKCVAVFRPELRKNKDLRSVILNLSKRKTL